MIANLSSDIRRIDVFSPDGVIKGTIKRSRGKVVVIGSLKKGQGWSTVIRFMDGRRETVAGTGTR
jgi:hypothetical protein